MTVPTQVSPADLPVTKDRGLAVSQTSDSSHRETWPRTYPGRHREAPDREYLASKRRLAELACYEEDWDGEGALALSPVTRSNAQSALEVLQSYLPMPEIDINPQGTVSFIWITRAARAHLEIGEGRISLYVKPRMGEVFFYEGSVDRLGGFAFWDNLRTRLATGRDRLEAVASFSYRVDDV